MKGKFLTNNTIELVGYGHPDRFADFLSEKVLTENLKLNKDAKVASEIIVMKDMVVLGGELTNDVNALDYQKLVHDAIEEIYGEKWWPNYKKVKVVNNIKHQSSELTTIQENAKKVVAGDQGVIYGYYSKDRFNKIRNLYKVIEDIKKDYDISPDWKLLYDVENNEISMSICGLKNEELNKLRSEKPSYIINPAGEWLVGGPLSDTGLTGRKLMIDTFGAGIPHGGGAFCGKDVSKVDKTAIIWNSLIAHEYFKLGKKYDEVFVESSYKIGDLEPRLTVKASRKGKIIEVKSNSEVNNLFGKTLNDFVENNKLKDLEWSKYVKQGGVISLVEELIEKK